MTDKKFRVTATAEITAKDEETAKDDLIAYIQDGALDFIHFAIREIPRTAFDDAVDEMLGV